VWNYFRHRPNFFKLWGKHISLPGSLESQTDLKIGEISAFTAKQIPRWLAPFQIISMQKLVQLPFNEKIDQIVSKSIQRDIRVITAVPSWLLTIFQRVLERTNSNSIAEVWPKLQLLVCGGVKLANYRPHLEKLLGKADVDFIETYGASEGYFSFTDDLQKDDMKLVIDNGIFYEFIPNPLPDPDSLSIQETVPLWEVETDTPYAMLVSTNAGLWRYAMNDIVTFTQTEPPRVKVVGRVSEMLDDYGEALYSFEAEEALHKAAEMLHIEVGTFTIAAHLESEQKVPHHQWSLQTLDTLHTDTLKRLAEKIDGMLREQNRHYEIRRSSNALRLPEIKTITQQEINIWLKEKGRNKAQGKLPKILRDQDDIDFFEAI